MIVAAEEGKVRVVIVAHLERHEAVGLVGKLSDAIAELWPDLDPNWNRDPNREDLSGRIGKGRNQK